MFYLEYYSGVKRELLSWPNEITFWYSTARSIADKEVYLLFLHIFCISQISGWWPKLRRQLGKLEKHYLKLMKDRITSEKMKIQCWRNWKILWQSTKKHSGKSWKTSPEGLRDKVETDEKHKLRNKTKKWKVCLRQHVRAEMRKCCHRAYE